MSELEIVRIGKCQNLNLIELEIVRIGICQNWLCASKKKTVQFSNIVKTLQEAKFRHFIRVRSYFDQHFLEENLPRRQLFLM